MTLLLALAAAALAPAATAQAQQAPQPLTAPRAPLGPGSDMRVPEPGARGRFAPQRNEGGPRAGPLARQDQQLAQFRGGLALALNRSSATTPPAQGLLVVNTTNGAFAGLLQLAGGETRRFSVAAFGQSALLCEACGERLGLLYHDGFARRDVAFSPGSRVYVIIHPLYERFEILSQSETARLAGIAP